MLSRLGYPVLLPSILLAAIAVFSCTSERRAFSLPEKPEWKHLVGHAEYDNAHIARSRTEGVVLWIRAEAQELVSPHQAALLDLDNVVIEYEVACILRRARILRLGERLDGKRAELRLEQGEYFGLDRKDEFHAALLNAACSL